MIYEWFFKAANPGDRRPVANDKRQGPAEPTTVDTMLTADRQQTDMDLSSNDDTILTGSSLTTLVNAHTQDG